MRKVQLTQPRFSGGALVRLILPLVAEQILAVTVGMADSVMVASVGEAAVSAVSLVDQVNILLIQIFAALATGGAVVASQYLGRREKDNACTAARQLVYVTLALSVLVAAVALVANRHLLGAVFGGVTPQVMEACVTYFWISALSYPFLGIYNAGAALLRSMGNSRVSLYASLAMNIINIGGNAVLIYGFGMGVAGAAIASLAGRCAAAVFVMVVLQNDHAPIHLRGLLRGRTDASMLRSILRIGVPNGIENGMFQVGKLLVTSLVASLGLAATTANAICNNIGSMVNVPGSAIGLAMVTVIGQCVGARDYTQARYYTRLLLRITYLGMGALSVLALVGAPWLIGFYGATPETTLLAEQVMWWFCFATMVFWPASFALPNMLRACGDARYTMTVSMVSMWLMRVAMSYVLVWAGLGLQGIWVAMYLDWILRGICFSWRFFSGKWQQARVIDS